MCVRVEGDGVFLCVRPLRALGAGDRSPLDVKIDCMYLQALYTLCRKAKDSALLCSVCKKEGESIMSGLLVLTWKNESS